MIRSSVGSLLLVLLTVLSASPALAAPQGKSHASHSPYKDYGSERSYKRQGLDVPNSVDSCVLPAAELPGAGDKELVFENIRYSELCLQQFALTLVPEERAVCRAECSTCTTVRGYNMPCIAERVVRRSTQVDLTQLRDTKQPPTRMVPTAPTDCIVPSRENFPIPSDGNWTPFTVVENQVFDNDCLTRFYLGSLSSTASCLPDDNTCMLDRALDDLPVLTTPR